MDFFVLIFCAIFVFVVGYVFDYKRKVYRSRESNSELICFCFLLIFFILCDRHRSFDYSV